MVAVGDGGGTWGSSMARPDGPDESTRSRARCLALVD